MIRRAETAGPSAGHATLSPHSGARPLVAGLGPHGERAASPESLGLPADMLELARTRAFRVAIVLHTTASDWAQRQVAGIEAVLSRAGATVVEIVDCDYQAGAQVVAIERLALSRLDAVIAIPVSSTAVAEAFQKLASTGIRLVLLDNGLSGLLPEVDYASVVSSDNFGLGQIAATLLSPHIPRNGSVCIVAYNVDFFATAQREIAFSKWMRHNRPDIMLSQLKFGVPGLAGAAVGAYLEGHADLNGLFVVWDEPAVASLTVLAERPEPPVMTTVDLGSAISKALGDGRIVKGVAAQRPFEQGETAATAVIAALMNNPVPPWIALPGIAVTAENVAEAYKHVGGAPTSFEMINQVINQN